jgi:chaperonin GroEL (HSP60 family)
MKSDRFEENLKNTVITCCPRVSDRFTENLKNKAIGSCGRVSAIACYGRICDHT